MRAAGSEVVWQSSPKAGILRSVFYRLRKSRQAGEDGAINHLIFDVKHCEDCVRIFSFSSGGETAAAENAALHAAL
jgi:hypothetical protein